MKAPKMGKLRMRWQYILFTNLWYPIVILLNAVAVEKGNYKAFIPSTAVALLPIGLGGPCGPGRTVLV